MIVPRTSLEPFGFTGIPSILMVRRENIPAAVARIYRACDKAEKHAIRFFKIMQAAHNAGNEFLQHDVYRYKLHVVFAGGTKVKCEIHYHYDDDKVTGFDMSLTFNVPNERDRYGLHVSHP